MSDHDKNRDQLVQELQDLRAQVAQFEQTRAERTRLLEQLRQEKVRFEAVLQHMSAAVCIVEAPSGKIVLISEQLERIFRHPAHAAESIADYARYQAFHRDGRPFVPEDWPAARVLAGGPPVHDEEIIIGRGDGTRGLIRVSAVPIRDAEGRLVAAVVTVLDLTEQRAAEDARRALEVSYHRLIETANEGIYLLDADLRLTYANRRLAEMLGYTVPEMLGRSPYDFMHEADHAAARELLSRRRQGIREQFDFRFRRRDGSDLWAIISTHPVLDEEGRFVNTLGMMTDITDRKKSQAALEDYAQRLGTLPRKLLQLQEAERRHLARELHDEIGGTLTGLNLTLELSPHLHGDELAGNLRQARRLVTDLAGRMRDMSLRLRPTMLDDLGLLPALLWHFERYTAQTRVRVHFEHDGLGRRLSAEVETAAYRIIQEALTNVARHAATDEVTVRALLEGDRLLLQVEDHGAGFDADAALAAGTSSGLSGMMERAALLGGRLDVESAPGRGTCLTAEFPLEVTGERRRDGLDAVAGR